MHTANAQQRMEIYRGQGGDSQKNLSRCHTQRHTNARTHIYATVISDSGAIMANLFLSRHSYSLYTITAVSMADWVLNDVLLLDRNPNTDTQTS